MHSGSGLLRDNAFPGGAGIPAPLGNGLGRLRQL